MSKEEIEQAVQQYTESEKQALRGLFDIYDKDGAGFIDAEELEVILKKCGRDSSQAKELIEMLTPEKSGKLNFDEFLFLMSKGRPAAVDDLDGSHPDSKVIEFLKILNEYRIKCEKEGNYMEAERATKQLKTLQRQEEKRQSKSLRARQIAERQDVQIAHNMQYAEFNAAWDKYMEEYDEMAQMYIQQMTQKHAEKRAEFERDIVENVTRRPPKYSRELLNWRKRQKLLAQQKNYAEAQKIKRLADKLEEKEAVKQTKVRKQKVAKIFMRFRAAQQKEMQALLCRIDARRKEHMKQRNEDSKRLLQRNKNVQQVLESKQAIQLQRSGRSVKAILSSTIKRK